MGEAGRRKRIAARIGVALALVVGLGGIPPAGASFTYTVLPNVSTGAGAWGVAVAPDGTIYVTNTNANTVSVVEGATEVAEIPVGSFPYDVTVAANGFVYVANVNSDSISVIDPATNTVIGAPIPVGSAPSGLAAHPSAARVYVTNSGSNSVSVIDTATNTVVGAPIAVATDPEGIAVAPDGTVYVANYAAGVVTVIASDAVVTTIPVAGGPLGITVGPDGFVYTANLDVGRVAKIDPVTNMVVASMPTPAVAGLYDVAVDTSGTIYASGFNNNFVYAIGSDGVLMGSMSAGAFFLRDVELSPDETIVYTASANLGTLQRLVPSSIPDTLELTAGPDDAAGAPCGITLFHASAKGQPLPTVQWQTSTNGIDWNPLGPPDWSGTSTSGETLNATAFVRADPERHGHRFRAVFGNVAGTVTSDPATLSVPPPIVSTPDPAPAGSITTGRRPAGITATPDGKMYVAEYLDETVATIEGNAVTDRVTVGERVSDVEVGPDGTVYAIRETQCAANLVEISGGVVTGTVDIPGQPGGLAVGTDGRVYVVAAYSEALHVVDGGVIVETLSMPQLPTAVAVAPDGTVYVASFGLAGDGIVTIVHPGGAQSSLTVGMGASDIAIGPDGTVYVTSTESDELAVIRGGAVDKTIATGIRPQGVAVDPSGVVYVANWWDDTVSVIVDDVVVDTVPVGSGPTALAIRPSNATAYVTNAFADSVSPVEWDPEPPVTTTTTSAPTTSTSSTSSTTTSSSTSTPSSSSTSTSSSTTSTSTSTTSTAPTPTSSTTTVKPTTTTVRPPKPSTTTTVKPTTTTKPSTTTSTTAPAPTSTSSTTAATSTTTIAPVATSTTSTTATTSTTGVSVTGSTATTTPTVQSTSVTPTTLPGSMPTEHVLPANARAEAQTTAASRLPVTGIALGGLAYLGAVLAVAGSLMARGRAARQRQLT